jgi:hypothetical protein
MRKMMCIGTAETESHVAKKNTHDKQSNSCDVHERVSRAMQSKEKF